MKLIFSALTLALAFTAVTSAKAADKKIGNVIAVERTIDNVYQNCIDGLGLPGDDTNFLTCTLKVKKTNEDFMNGYQRLLTLTNGGCEVEGTAQAGSVMISFQDRRPKASIDDSKACLRKALDASVNKDSFKFIIYTIE